MLPILVLILIPIISALIGWLTNWVAIRMLFHPRKPILIGNFKLQGLIPRRQPDIAEQAADDPDQDDRDAEELSTYAQIQHGTPQREKRSSITHRVGTESDTRRRAPSRCRSRPARVSRAAV